MVRWRESRRSTNVDDRRGSRVARMGGLGGGIGLVVLVIYTLLGGNPLQLLQVLDDGQGSGRLVETEGATPGGSSPSDETGAYLSAILGMTEDVWSEIFRRAGAEYEEPTLVLFDGAVRSACGLGSVATGPFYCPADRSLYLDTSFFQELSRMGAPGDFAQAYVIGHEVGHHVQALTGTFERARGAQQRSRSEREANRLQVLMELQADCYAGIWAHHANRREQILEPGDAEEGLDAAGAIGDDRLQRRAGREVAAPETFTHGSSAQRRRWLLTGMESGDVEACDTFEDAGLSF